MKRIGWSTDGGLATMRRKAHHVEPVLTVLGPFARALPVSAGDGGSIRTDV
jgi:hypothetical protein